MEPEICGPSSKPLAYALDCGSLPSFSCELVASEKSTLWFWDSLKNNKTFSNNHFLEYGVL